MTLNEFRKKLEAWWVQTDAREVDRKNSQGALLAFMDLYRGMALDERDLADQVIAEWIDSDNGRQRFDARAMADSFRIRAAVAPLKRAEAQLATSKDHEAPYELAKIRRILARIEDWH